MNGIHSFFHNVNRDAYRSGWMRWGDLVGGYEMTEEGALVKQILDYLHIHGVFAWRNNTTGIWDPAAKRFRKNAGLNGISDILGILPNGTFLAIECKARKGRTTQAQNDFIDNINKRGGLAIVARSLNDIDGMFSK